MTAQEAYEQIRAHFSKPGAVLAIGADGKTCLYRGPEGASSPTRCAVGVCLKDEDYDPAMDDVSIDPGTSIADLLDRGLLPPYLQDTDVFSFLEKAQYEHDTTGANEGRDATETLLTRLDHLAKQHGLTVPT